MTGRELKRAAFLFLLPAALFLHPLLLGRVHFLGDITFSFQPWLTYAAQEIQAGRLPLWDPYSACGQPFLGNPGTMILYPPAALFWLFPYPSAQGLFLLFNQAMGFFSMYLLASRWLGGRRQGLGHPPALLAALAFSWGGFALAHWEFASASATIPWLPLSLLMALGGSRLALAGTIGLTLAAGYSPLAPHAVFLALVGTLARSRGPDGRWTFRPILGFLAAVPLGALLAAPQLAASWEMTRLSLRSLMGSGEALGNLLSPISFIRLLVPWVTNPVALAFSDEPFGAGHWSIQRNWLATLFLGTGPLLLALAGVFRAPLRRSVLLGLVGAASLTLAMGIEPVVGWVRAAVPGFRYLTHLSTSVALFLLALCLWAAEGAHRTARRNLLLAFFVLACAGTCLALALSADARLWTLRGLLGLGSLTERQDRWVSSAAGGAAASVFFFGALWLLFRRRRWAAVWLFTLLELWLLGRTFQPSAPGSFFRARPWPAQAMAGSPHRYAISPATMKQPKRLGGRNLVEGVQSARQAFHPNMHLPYRVHHTWAYEVFGLRRFADFRRLVPDLPGESPAFDFLGASRVMSAEPLPPPSRPLARSENALLYSRPSPQPRVLALGRAVVLPDPAERLKRLAGPWRPSQEVVLEEGAPGVFDPPALDFWQDAPGRVLAQGKGPGWLVYSGVHVPGWRGYVNGRPVPVRIANHAFQAVELPGEAWRVHLVYRPRPFRAGLWVCLIAWLAVGGFSWVAALRFTPAAGGRSDA